MAKRGRAGRFVADRLEARHPAAFLVDRDEWLGMAEVAQIVGELPQASGGDDVAREKHVAAGLDAPQRRGGVGVEFGARQADEENLAGVGGGHEKAKGKMQKAECRSRK